ncbi:hypothetical protein TRIATDRAFT_291373 [Trichoderma atroviride IMI 206040]|uniref:F-box domain-containing protein n=2 Tax=Hypocrea atroviridis TaxID=63577 RepID=G9NQ48_HYPAI|nr:uncharacterized protein TRIATDRAFT_291373 [Trichoderma atroviride IMI 206040]EHK47197.1 hypothetical protein TRIATDRAFT_291373 [Trichoderma atroviride IMI 206040]
MKSLLDCPAEIVHSILECLPAASLRDLCLVSRGLREVAEPLLYAHLLLIWLGGDPPPSFIILLQNLQRRPQLAKYVQSLSLAEGYTRNGWRISVDSSELASLIAIIQDINPPFRDLWIQELRNGTPDAIVMLLLSLAPNITDLRLTGKFSADNRLLGRMLRASLCQTVDCNLPRFQHLRQVLLDTQSSIIRHPEMQNTADALSLFYLPAVQSITANIDNPAILVWPAHVPSPSNITSNETNNDIINLDQIAEDLSFVKDTLEKLKISGDVSSDPELDDIPELEIQGSLRPLSRFEKLHKLVILQQFLIGFSPDDDLGSLKNLMPKNIHHLTITDDMALLEQNILRNLDLFMLLRDWWTNLETHTPYFHSLKLQIMNSDMWSAGREHDLDALCAQFGIRLAYRFQKPLLDFD